MHLIGTRNEAEAARAAEAEVYRAARLIADRLGEDLATVGRDVSLAAENVVFARDRNGEAIRPFLERWRALHPGYADILIADRNGRVLATASGSLAGADVSQTTWFARGLSGIVIGDASDRTRAGADAPLNVIVGAPVRAGGAVVIGVLAVQLKPDSIQETVAALRNGLGGTARDAVVQIMNAGGRMLHRSTGATRDGTVHEAIVAVAESTGLGWMVSVRAHDRVAADAGPNAPTLAALAAASLFAAYAGGALGGWLSRDLKRIVSAAREDRADRLGDAAVADFAALSDAVGACIGRSQGRERLLGESRGALARSRDRVRSVRLLGGFTCWEVDLRNGRVTWADGSAAAIENAAERTCDLEEMVARIDADDRDLLTHAMRAACEDPGSIREVVIRTQAGPEDAAGRRLVLRLTAVALHGHPVRLHALTREIAQAALPAPVTASVAPGAALADPPAGFPARAVIAGIAQDVGGALDAIAAALNDIESETGFARRHRIETARRDAARGAALVKHMTALVDPVQASAENEDVTQILARTVAFIQAAILPSLAMTPSAGTLPELACSTRELEVALLNLASDAQASLPADAVVTLSITQTTAISGDARPGLRVDLSLPHGFRAGRGIDAVQDQMDAIDGSMRVASAAEGIAVALVFPITSASIAQSDPTGTAQPVLLVEPDAVLRAATAESLTGRGYVVTPVASAEQAIDALAKSRDFAVLLCAHALPGLDGASLAEVTSRTHPRVAIVLMSPEPVRSQGGSAFQTLCKPFSGQDLIDAVDGAVTPLRRADAA